MQLYFAADIAKVKSSFLISIYFQYRFMFGLAVVPSVIQFIGFLFMPDTPRWLISKGRFDKARTVLQRFRGPAVDVDDEITDISISIQQDAENRKFRARNDNVHIDILLYVSAEEMQIRPSDHFQFFV